jgi:hypothetical protein
MIRTNLESCGNTAFRETEIATTVNGSIGCITVDSNRNFIICGYVNTLQGRVETTVRESVNFKSKHNFNVNLQHGHSGSSANPNYRIDDDYPRRSPDDYEVRSRRGFLNGGQRTAIEWRRAQTFRVEEFPLWPVKTSTFIPFRVSARLKITAKGMPHKPDALPIGRCGHLSSGSISLYVH